MASTAEFIRDFTKDIPRGFAPRDFSRPSAPQAAWQSPQTVMTLKRLAYDPANPGAKILVGAMDSKLIGIEDNRHILTIAGSRAGKSVTLIANLLFYGGSVFCVDPKGELAGRTASRRAALGQDVAILDPFLICDEDLARYRRSYNPLSLLNPKNDTVIEDAALIADGMVTVAKNDPHWDESAKQFIEGLILHVATCPGLDGKRDLLTVRALLGSALEDPPDDEDGPQLYIVENAMLDNAARLSDDPATEDVGAAIERAARSFYDKGEREQSSVLSNAQRHTQYLDSKAMKRVLAGDSEIDLRALKSNPNGMSVYLCLPATRLGLFSSWLRILLNQLLDAMEQEKAKPPAPVLVCLDEFPVLGHMKQLEDAAGQIASFDVKLWIILQDWNQGKALYGDRFESFAANAGIWQFFGNVDATTTEYISRKLGKTLVRMARYNEVAAEQRRAGMTGHSEVDELHDLMTPEEISRYFSREDHYKRQLVIWAGYDPMILQRVEYFDSQGPLAAFIENS